MSRRTWVQFWRLLTETARLMVGVKDYERYLEACRHRPGTRVMSREDFFLHCQVCRHGGESVHKCPC